MAAGSTYTPIATTTLGSASNSITFSSISGSYTDLVLVMNYGMTSGTSTPAWRYNGDTSGSTLYSQTILTGDGSSASANRITIGNLHITMGYTNSSSITANSIIHIMNYSNTTTYKTSLARGNSTNNSTQASACLYRSTSAITSINVFPDYATTFVAGSTFTLYGIAAA